MKRADIKPGKNFKPRTKPMSGAGTPTASPGILRVAAVDRERKTKAKKSCGFKGRTPTRAEQRLMDAVARLGCRACTKEDIENLHISLHHIDGRMKEGAYFKVLPLCAPHHQQDDSDPMGGISAHGAKRLCTHGLYLCLFDQGRLCCTNLPTAPERERG